ncbi:transporter, partial [Psychroserpens sp.]|uniref:transporter n=1 Tax=Psychroserpens sp. TaxID=2020870 RepID=UPI003C782E48
MSKKTKMVIGNLERSLKVFLSMCCFFIPTLSFAQDDAPNKASQPLVTDRPDATEASATVGKGTLQIETGGLYESFKDNAVQSQNYTFNTTLIRFGILDNLELRMGWDFVEGVTTVNGNTLDNVSSGLSPLLLGVKIDISEEINGLPEIALIGHVFPLFSASA